MGSGEGISLLIIAGLILIFIAVLFLPFRVKAVEKREMITEQKNVIQTPMPGQDEKILFRDS